MIISKEKFTEIISKHQEANDIGNKVDSILRNSSLSLLKDFGNISGLMMTHEDVVIDLLELIFNETDMISYWIYELDYGRKYKDGCFCEANGTNIDISSASKLYDYIIKEV